jgi:predicted TIM-barrel fold metal-dependent hydrolase
LGLEVLDRFAQVHTLSHPFAQMLQLTSIVMSGILDLFPGLRWAFLEAGAGWVPFIMDRMDRSYEGRKHHDYIGGVRHRPSTYIKSGKVFFTADPTERTLAYAAGVIAADALIFASDFPHETNLASCRRDIETLGNASDLSLETRRKILGVNARRLYQLGGA